MFGKAGLGGLMKQAQQMQENMKKAQAKLAETEIEGEAGNGLVKITMTCAHEVRKIDISPDLIQEAADDKEMLEDLILAALKSARGKAEETANKTMGAFTQDLTPGVGDFFR
ncbi:TPA: YbaB/EbfC family nucleoid-associated protein [Neisseria gonorrhoeae]